MPPRRHAPWPPDRSATRPDIATVGGLILAIGGIVGGLIMEGGKLQDISQLTAAIIVLGGTCGAVMVSTPMNILLGAARRLVHVILDKTEPPEAVIDELIGYAAAARRSGLVSLENDAMQIQDPFLRKALNLAVDGTDLQEIRGMMQLEIELSENRALAEAKVFESAWRLLAHHWNYRRGAGPHSGDEEPRQHRGSWARNCRGLRGHRVWRRLGECRACCRPLQKSKPASKAKPR